jgi:hypothetical protein
LGVNSFSWKELLDAHAFWIAQLNGRKLERII